MDPTPRILLAEDNAADVDLALEAFRECGVHAHFYIAPDGQEAWDLLTNSGPYASVVLPDLIILDLNMPRLSGRELLPRIKRHERLRRIPTVVLTTSHRQQDIDGCYDGFANTYIVKPPVWSEFLAMVRSLDQYWLHTVQLP